MGLVVDEVIAKNSPCKCYVIPSRHGDIDHKELLCWSKGIIGALTDWQETIYCPDKEIIEDGKKLKRHIIEFSEAIAKCKGLPFTDFIECVKRELKD